jgi:hypothetical protein
MTFMIIYQKEASNQRSSRLQNWLSLDLNFSDLLTRGSSDYWPNAVKRNILSTDQTRVLAYGSHEAFELPEEKG